MIFTKKLEILFLPITLALSPQSTLTFLFNSVELTHLLSLLSPLRAPKTKFNKGFYWGLMSLSSWSCQMEGDSFSNQWYFSLLFNALIFITQVVVRKLNWVVENEEGQS